jgi:hypothetical protein
MTRYLIMEAERGTFFVTEILEKGMVLYEKKDNERVSGGNFPSFL